MAIFGLLIYLLFILFYFSGKAKAKFEKYHGISEIKQYPDAADSTLPSTSKRKRSDSEVKPEIKEEVNESMEVKEESSEKKKKKKKKGIKEEGEDLEEQSFQEVAEDTPKKKKKKAKQEIDESLVKEESKLISF